jgi:glutaminyl-peptide cyclotransferase
LITKRNLPFHLCFLCLLIFDCTSSPERFNAERAFSMLLQQCEFGPRHPGSDGHRKAKEYLLDNLAQHTSFVKAQEFVHQDEEQDISLRLANIVASFYPENGKRILLCAHWDTRPFADMDPDPTLRARPILGANDGASGVAVLLETARIISRSEPQWGVDMVFFDGEDGGEEGQVEGFCLGSKYFVENKGSYRPEFGILLDMIGDKDLQIYREGYSNAYAPAYVDLIWSRAEALELTCFRDSVKHFVYDDHVPFLGAGIPVVDLIDFDYPYWHTASDTPDKCSPESLQKIGDLILDILYGGN